VPVMLSQSVMPRFTKSRTLIGDLHRGKMLEKFLQRLLMLLENTMDALCTKRQQNGVELAALGCDHGGNVALEYLIVHQR